VVVQSAGGADSNLTLAFLDNRRAEDLRLRLLELAARTDERVPERDAGLPGPVVAAPPGAAPGIDRSGAALGATAEETGARARAVEDLTPLVTVPNVRLFVATILHGSTIVLGAMALAVFGSGRFRELAFVFAGVPALLPLAFGVAVSRVRELLTNGNFSLAHTGTALRVRHGLTDLRVSTVPLHRVQAVEVLQPLWWRPFGWWRVRVNVAGVQGSGEDSLETVLLPVGEIDDVLTVLVSLGARREDPRLVEALLGQGGEPGWVGLPRQARWLDPWVWQRAGYLLAPQAVLLRRGRFTRRTAVVPYARVQSLTLTQGALQRRLGLASVTVVSTPGPVSGRLDHLAADDAEVLLDSLAARARVARRAVPTPGHPSSPGVPAIPLAPGTAPLVD
jgi:putative membrane protein